MLAFVLLPAVVWVPLGIYLYHIAARFLTLFGVEKKSKLSVTLSLAAALLCAVWGWQLYDLGAVAILHFLAFSAVFDILRLLFRRKIKKEKTKKILDILYRSNVVVIFIVCLIFAYGAYNIKDVRKTEYRIETKKKAEDFKIVQISDLHMGTTMRVETLETYAKQIQDEEPDLLALTGDIFDENTTKEEMKEAVDVLKNIKTAYGIYYVFGNHDYNSYTNDPYYTKEELVQTLEENEIHVLEDEKAVPNQWLTVVGRTDASVDRAEIGDLMAQGDQDHFVLLLDHQPRGLEENKAAGIDLQLSGHTHAGQIWPTGQLGSLLGVTELNYGYQKDDNYQAIVSSGIGGWGYAIRTGGHSEYVVVEVSSVS